MAGELLDMQLLDHVIVTDGDYSSIRSIDERIFDPSYPKQLTEFLIAESNINGDTLLP